MRYDLIMNYMLRALLLAPGLIIGLDMLAVRDRDVKRIAVGTLSFAGSISLLAYFDNWGSTNVLLFLLATGSLAVFYARDWLTGLARYLTLLSGIAFLTHTLARQLPGIGIWGRYQQLFQLPITAAALVVPLPLVWHLWRQLPLTFDALRKGNWREAGVPLAVRYKLLSTIAILALLLNVFLLSQLMTSREQLRRQVNLTLMSVHNDLRGLHYGLRHREQLPSDDWLNSTLLYIRDYQIGVRRLNTLVSPGVGSMEGGANYFLAETFSLGMRQAILADAQLTDRQYQGLIVITETFLEAIDKDWGVRGVTPEGMVAAAEGILAVVQGYDLGAYFDIE